MQLIQDQCKETKTTAQEELPEHRETEPPRDKDQRAGGSLLRGPPRMMASGADREQHEEETRVQAREAAADVVTVEELAEEEIPQEAEVEAAANSQPEDEAQREARVSPEAELAAAGEAVTGGFPRVGGVAAAAGEIADPAAAAAIGSGQRALPLRAGSGEEMTDGRGEPVRKASGIEAGADSTRGARGRRRPQPESRRLGVTLAPTLPGPLWGWLRQEPMPHDPEDPTTLGAAAEAVQVGDVAVSQQQKRRERRQRHEMGETAPPAVQRAARGDGRIRWVAPSAPWIPAGRGGQRGGAEGGGRAQRGRGRARAPPEPPRSGSWRERHGRQEPITAQGEEEQEDGDAANEADDPSFMASATPSSENISLPEEEEVGSRAARIPRAGAPPHNVDGMPAPAADPVAAPADPRAHDV
ncbi:unnamed protein product [Closterium sp. NIES-64]|nr:unnamed protein product [Closterium sp. NIES-64]